MDHVVQVGNRAVWVADHREVNWRALCFSDVAFPLFVRFDAVNRKADYFDVALIKLWFDLGDVAKLGGAHRGEVLRVAEQYAPRIAEPVVKLDLALCGCCSEVGCDIAETNGHGVLLKYLGGRSAYPKPDQTCQLLEISTPNDALKA